MTAEAGAGEPGRLARVVKQLQSVKLEEHLPSALNPEKQGQMVKIMAGWEKAMLPTVLSVPWENWGNPNYWLSTALELAGAAMMIGRFVGDPTAMSFDPRLGPLLYGTGRTVALREEFRQQKLKGERQASKSILGSATDWRFLTMRKNHERVSLKGQGGPFVLLMAGEVLVGPTFLVKGGSKEDLLGMAVGGITELVGIGMAVVGGMVGWGELTRNGLATYAAGKAWSLGAEQISRTSRDRPGRAGSNRSDDSPRLR